MIDGVPTTPERNDAHHIIIGWKAPTQWCVMRLDSGVPLIRATDPPRPFAKLGWPGRRFRVLRELGEPRDFSFLHYDQNGHLDHAERHIRHEDHDGVGAFSALMAERGIHTPLPLVAPPPTGWRRWWLLWKFMQYNRTVAAIRKRVLDHGADPATAVCLLSAEETSAVLAQARAEHSSATSWLLANLDELTAAAALVPDSPRSWMVPVNLRTATNRDADNAVGAMMLPFYSTRTAAELRDTIDHQVRAQLPFGPQALVPWMLRQPEQKLRRRANRAPRVPVFGLLTNLGAWPAEAKPGWWVVVPPTSRGSWLACGVITIGGCMSLCLKADVRLGLEANDLLDIMTALRRRIPAPPQGHLFTEASTAEQP
jgi:hypothetical protein